jgi:hypothetical protein
MQLNCALYIYLEGTFSMEFLNLPMSTKKLACRLNFVPHIPQYDLYEFLPLT